MEARGGRSSLRASEARVSHKLKFGFSYDLRVLFYKVFIQTNEMNFCFVLQILLQQH